MKIVTYNVHRCVGSDGRGSVERIAEVLDELAPDIVALQEVVSSATLPRVGQLERLADAAGFLPVPGGTLVESDSSYGNGLLLRDPPVATVRHDLSVPRREPRGAIEVVIELASGPVRVINTHLGLRGRERRRQVARLEQVVTDRPEPVLALMGDMNEWRPGPLRGPLRALSALLEPAPSARTFPARRPVVALDRIWTDARFEIVASGSHRSAQSRVASDHLPFFVELAEPRSDPASVGAWS